MIEFFLAGVVFGLIIGTIKIVAESLKALKARLGSQNPSKGLDTAHIPSQAELEAFWDTHN
jgi:hypothetical protein